MVRYRPTKYDPNRTRLTIGSNLINFPGDCGTPTVYLLTVKMHLNSTISTKKAHYITIDIKDFHLNTPMERYKYMRLKLVDLPDDVAKQYDLGNKVTADGWIYLEVRKRMYGLPQAGLLAKNLLEERLNKKGYKKSELTPGLWTHQWSTIFFTFCVDDFGVKYFRK